MGHWNRHRLQASKCRYPFVRSIMNEPVSFIWSDYCSTKSSTRCLFFIFGDRVISGLSANYSISVSCNALRAQVSITLLVYRRDISDDVPVPVTHHSWQYSDSPRENVGSPSVSRRKKPHMRTWATSIGPAPSPSCFKLQASFTSERSIESILSTTH